MALTCPVADTIHDIERRLEERIGSQRFKVWFKNSSNLALDHDQLVIQVSNNFVGGWIKNHFSEPIRETVKEILHNDTPVVYQINANLVKPQTSTPEEPEPRSFKEPGKMKFHRKLRNTTIISSSVRAISSRIPPS
jgi:chromosomal replication initiation ATPase DnaA